jgi:hypothetical protein
MSALKLESKDDCLVVTDQDTGKTVVCKETETAILVGGRWILKKSPKLIRNLEYELMK